MKKAHKVPAAFASEAEERACWEREDSTGARDVAQREGWIGPSNGATRQRLNFLYFSRCGMTLSMPRRRFLSSS